MRYQTEENKFTWGDNVKVIDTAPPPFKAGEYASICGFTKMSGERLKNEYNIDGYEFMYVYTSEYPTGPVYEHEIPEIYLELHEL